MNTIPLKRPLPTTLNLGCGTDLRDDCLNIDINRAIAADAWIDLAAAGVPDSGVTLETVRFGNVTLMPGSFQHIVLRNVLQQVQDLPAMMTACMRLLARDGTLDIIVPYDLSYGAWADPANVRGFNEASFVAYADNTDVFGWKNTLLQIETMDFIPTELGQRLAETGMTAEEVSRQPRAIHGIAVGLRKTVTAVERTPSEPALQIRPTHSGPAQEPASFQVASMQSLLPAPAATASSPSAPEHGHFATVAQTAAEPAVHIRPTHSGPAQAPSAFQAGSMLSQPAVLAPVALAPYSAPTPVVPEPVYPEPEQAAEEPEKRLVAFPGGWDEHKDKHCIWIATPTGYIHSRAFDDVAFGLHCAFEELGGSAPLARSPDEWDNRIPIVYGANLLPVEIIDVLPAGCIMVNLEQISSDSPWMSDNYLKILNSFPVLDYSARNRQALADLGVKHAELLEIGYSERLTHITPAPFKDIDVLFYGSMNERRAELLNALKARGLNVVHLFGVYGKERDEAIARAKIVLNMHALKSAIFEVVRVSYLLANRVCVLTEGDINDSEIQPYLEGLAVAPYDELVERCVALIGNASERERLAERGFEIMSRRSQADMLMETMNNAFD